MRALICSSVLLLCGALGVSSQASPGCVTWISHVQRPGGWDVSLIDFHHKTYEGPMTLGGTGVAGPFAEVIAIGYATRGDYFDYTDVLADTCKHEATLRSVYLHVKAAWGLALHGKTFALVLSGDCGEMDNGHRVPMACATEVTLIDSTGSGKFDVLAFGKQRPDSIPQWVNSGKKP